MVLPLFLPKSYSLGNSSILSYITKACHHSSDGSSIATNCNTQLFGFPSFNLQSRQSHHHLIYSSIQCSFKSFFHPNLLPEISNPPSIFIPQSSISENNKHYVSLCNAPSSLSSTQTSFHKYYTPKSSSS